MTFTDILNEASCDERIKNGVLDIKNEEHILILEEYLIKHGYPLEEVVNKMAKYIKEGNYPERQAYNRDGVLVTFPSPEYKQRAIKKGTHFEKNPKAGGDGTLFGTPVNQPGTYADDGQDLSMFQPEKQPFQTVPDDGDSIPLEKELADSGEGIESGDIRTNDEKKQDAEYIENIFNITEPTMT